MEQSNGIKYHLPYLRRFARLLTGQQHSGDVMVLTTLQKLAEAKADLNPLTDIKLAMYRTLTGVWRSPLACNFHDIDRNEHVNYRPLQHIAELDLLSRPAFLLVTIEGFSHIEAAGILEVELPDFEQLLMIAHQEVSKQLATDVLIIEDELLIAFELEDLMLQLGHRVTSVVRTRKQAVKEAARRKPKLILADIHLADGSSGIDAVKDIIEGNQAPVIFITAYPERLLTGLRPEPTFLAAKPFRPEQISALVSQALFFDVKSRLGVGPAAVADAVMNKRGYNYAR